MLSTDTARYAETNLDFQFYTKHTAVDIFSGMTMTLTPVHIGNVPTSERIKGGAEELSKKLCFRKNYSHYNFFLL